MRTVKHLLRAMESQVVRHFPQAVRDRVWHNPLFDARWYANRYPEVQASGLTPEAHFRRVGWREGRDPDDMFDTAWYLATYPEVARAGVNPLDDYYLEGARRHRNPSTRFDTDAYLDVNADIRASGVNPLLHYLRWGRMERRTPLPRDLAVGFTNPELSVRTGRGRRAIVAADAPIGVVVHLYYTELWDEIARYVDNLDRVRLMVGLTHETGDGMDRRIRAEYPAADVRYFPNVGRDVGSFMELLASGAFDGCEVVSKLHSKRSIQLVDGDEWRHDMLDELLGSRETCSRNIAAFRSDPRLGLLGPSSWMMPIPKFLGRNPARLRRFLRTLDARDGLEMEPDGRFVAGTMFWFRPSALEPLRALNIRQADFDPERGQHGGTLQHLLEIGIPLAVRAAGYTVRGTDEIQTSAVA